jgi:hypothetical protein
MREHRVGAGCRQQGGDGRKDRQQHRSESGPPHGISKFSIQRRDFGYGEIRIELVNGLFDSRSRRIRRIGQKTSG